MPRTFGDGLVHMSHIDVMIYDDFKLHQRPPITIDDTSAKIGKIIAEELVEDGATLQMGESYESIFDALSICNQGPVSELRFFLTIETQLTNANGEHFESVKMYSQHFSRSHLPIVLFSQSKRNSKTDA